MTHSAADQNLARRLVSAGAVGIILPTALFAYALLMPLFYDESRYCSHYLGCPGFLIEAWDPGRWVAIALSWPLLYLFRVRPAWQVAGLATLFLLALWEYASEAGDPAGLIILSAVIAFPSATVATAKGLGPIWRAAIVTPFPVLYLLAILQNA